VDRGETGRHVDELPDALGPGERHQVIVFTPAARNPMPLGRRAHLKRRRKKGEMEKKVRWIMGLAEAWRESPWRRLRFTPLSRRWVVMVKKKSGATLFMHALEIGSSVDGE